MLKSEMRPVLLCPKEFLSPNCLDHVRPDLAPVIARNIQSSSKIRQRNDVLASKDIGSHDHGKRLVKLVRDTNEPALIGLVSGPEAFSQDPIPLATLDPLDTCVLGIIWEASYRPTVFPNILHGTRLGEFLTLLRCASLYQSVLNNVSRRGLRKPVATL